MRIGLFTSNFGRWVLLHKGESIGYKTRAGDVMMRPGLPLEDVLPIIAEIGYETLNICPWMGHTANPYSMSKRVRHELPRMVEDLGMTISTVGAHGGSRHNFDRYGYVTQDEEELQQRHDYMRACIDLAAEWDVPIVEDVVGSAPDGWEEEEAWAHVVEAVSANVEYAKSNGVKIGIELYAGVVNSPERFVRLYDEVGSENLGCTMDPSNLVAGYPDMVKNMEILGRYIISSHIKGVRESGITTPGGPDDTFDIAQYAQLLNQYGYKGSFVIEDYPDSYSPPLEPAVSAKIAFDSVVRILDSLGLRG